MKINTVLSEEFDLETLAGRMKMLWNAIQKNALTPLHGLIVLQVAYLVLGYLYLDFNLSVLDAITAVTTAVLVEFAWTRRRFFPGTALAAGLGIAIFFRASHPAFFALAALVAISSKHVIKIRGNHVFNPSNIAIVVCALLFPYAATVELTQWGSDPYVHVLIATLSFAVAYWAGVFLTTATFVASYSVLLAILTPYYPLIAAHHLGILGPSFVLFASFMITDPRTAPKSTIPRLLHGSGIAFLYFALEMMGVRYAIFIAPFLTTILNVASRELSGMFFAAHKVSQFFNAPTALISLALCMFFWSPVLRGVPSSMISWQFLLFGVESQTLHQCARDPAYQVQKETGIARGGSSLGAAWGDYDRDGFDDLFVASHRGPSILYHNEAGTHFREVNAELGIPYVGVSSGVFVDYDNDGLLDLFLAKSDGGFSVLKNKGTRFEDVTADLGLNKTTTGGGFNGVTFSDYDNDGYLDFLVATAGEGLFLESDRYMAIQKSLFDPYFPQHTQRVCDVEKVESLLPDLRPLLDPSDEAEFARLLRDPELCVVISRGLARWISAAPSENSPITTASLQTPGNARLYRNIAGRKFIEERGFEDMIRRLYPDAQAALTRIDTHPYKNISYIFWQPISFDYDLDGKTDIFLTVDNGTNLLFKNLGSFEFSDVTEVAGINYFGTGMGIDVGDYNLDGFPDVFVDNVNEDYLFKNNGDGSFTNNLGLELGSLGVGWGASFTDYDLDGLQDIYVVNGDTSLLRTVTGQTSLFAFGLSRPLLRSDTLYRNTGDGFRVSPDLCSDTHSGRALALSDYDNSGTEDAFVGNITTEGYHLRSDEGDQLLKNKYVGRYVAIRLEGSTSNRMGIGAEVRLRTRDTQQTKWLLLGNSFYSQNSQKLIFGLGEQHGPFEIEVQWPSGKKSLIVDVEENSEITIRE